MPQITYKDFAEGKHDFLTEIVKEGTFCIGFVTQTPTHETLYAFNSANEIFMTAPIKRPNHSFHNVDRDWYITNYIPDDAVHIGYHAKV